ncbi:hypothetical protein Cgig2_023720 [Carnegiea gigantea]|uniref:Uncharacterized protein n=1 Tax=Carnegiea gigantea TaxID=171969 RepID=A0A9Q1QJL6_9CARY|nr:hypothetical protein Cgig2_023720 [Carnegiea gigantea]
MLAARWPAAAAVRRFPSRLILPWLLAALLDRLLLAFFLLTRAHLLSSALLLLLNPDLLSVFVQLVERIPGSIFVLPSFVIQCRKLLGAMAANFWASSHCCSKQLMDPEEISSSSRCKCLESVRSGPVRVLTGPVRSRTDPKLPLLGPRSDKFSVLGPAGPVRFGPVRSWTDEHP